MNLSLLVNPLNNKIVFIDKIPIFSFDDNNVVISLCNAGLFTHKQLEIKTWCENAFKIGNYRLIGMGGEYL